MRLCQIAMSVTDLRRTHAWYRDVLGVVPAGGPNTFVGPLASRVQGLERAASTCWWLLDGQEQFQLELFQFRSPRARPHPAGWRPCDIGYTMVSVHVRDLDATLARAAAAATPALTAPIGPDGARRCCVRDPEGVLLELMEDDPRGPERRSRPPDRSSALVRSVTLSVPDLGRSRRTFQDVLGLAPAGELALRGPEHEALWGLEGASRISACYWADDIAVELAQYERPAARPWPPGYRISDQGLLNVAFWFNGKSALMAAFARCTAAGMRANSRPVSLPGVGAVTYVNDPDGFSIELLTVTPRAQGRFGFRPRPTPRFAPLLPRAW